MKGAPADLAALIGSRICHDIISPIGAINNGLELMQMTLGSEGPEAALIRQSCAAAEARVAFFRMAYGAAGDTQAIGPDEVRALLDRLAATGMRQRIDWQHEEPVPRSEVQLAFLGLQCMETALPTGGAVAVARRSGRWAFEVTEGAPRFEGAHWQALFTDGSADETAPTLRPEHVQFALLPVLLAGHDRRPEVTGGADRPTLVI